ncbi:hypothetical protein DL765_008742 [Monosporascus sp. GIB2]|nr:hypothetical protein DL765_008742 [Monosporascus sp. GIB2]
MVGMPISQGLILPVPEFTDAIIKLEELRQRQPYDEAVHKLMQLSFEVQLGVKKWELTPDVAKRNARSPEVSDWKFWPVSLDNYLPAKLKRLNRNIAAQGELCGSTISQNRDGFDQGKHQYYMFRIFDIDEQKSICPEERMKLAGELDPEHVPVMGYIKPP